MKVRLKDVFNSLDALRSLAQIKFKASLAFKLVKLLKDAEMHLKEYENVRVQKVEQYNLSPAPSESDSQELKDLYVARKNVADMELNELLDSYVDVYDVKLSESDFEGHEISSGHLLLLHWLMEDEKA